MESTLLLCNLILHILQAMLCGGSTQPAHDALELHHHGLSDQSHNRPFWIPESPHPLLEMAEQELAPLVPRQPSTVGLKRVPQHAWAEPVTVCDGAATIAFESAGAIALLRTAGSNRSCKPPRYRCHLGCILLKMPAMLTGTGVSVEEVFMTVAKSILNKRLDLAAQAEREARPESVAIKPAWRRGAACDGGAKIC